MFGLGLDTSGDHYDCCNLNSTGLARPFSGHVWVLTQYYQFREFHAHLGNFQSVSEPNLTFNLNRHEKRCRRMVKKCLELVLLDGSNYESWCNSISHNIEAFNPYLLSIFDASICLININWANLSEKKRKCLKLNA
jgi:hypothetical protein